MCTCVLSGAAAHAASCARGARLRLSEDALLLRVEIVETASNVARELEMLPLVLAHRHEARLRAGGVCGTSRLLLAPGERGGNRARARLVEKNVRRHQHGVVEQPDANILALLACLLLILYHALEPVDGRRAIEKPRELGVRSDMTLRARARGERS